MRYLRNFNEDIETWLDFEIELKEFCNNYLSYLKDMGFIIIVRHQPYKYKSLVRKFKIEIELPIKNGMVQTFNLSSIKDDLFQFITLLDNEYKISDRMIKYVGVRCGNIYVENLEDIDEISGISEIFIIVQKYIK
jgi:hypothetical protein